MLLVISWQLCFLLALSISTRNVSWRHSFSISCHARNGGRKRNRLHYERDVKQRETLAFKRNTRANCEMFLGQGRLNSLAPLPAVYSSEDLYSCSQSAPSASLMMQRVTSRRRRSLCLRLSSCTHWTLLACRSRCVTEFPHRWVLTLKRLTFCFAWVWWSDGVFSSLLLSLSAHSATIAR